MSTGLHGKGWWTHTVAFVGLLVALVLVLTACGGPATTAPPATEETEEPTEAVTEEPTEAPTEAEPEYSGTLTHMTWGGEYTEADIAAYLQPMANEFGIDYETVDAPAEMLAKLQAMVEADAVTVDTIDFGPQESFYAWENGLLEPLPEDLKPELIEACGEDAVTDFGIITSLYANVIACNADAVEACPTNAVEFWDVENFPGPRMMGTDDWYHVIPFALMADGVPKDELFPLDWDRAFEKLDEIKPYITVWYTSGDQSQQAFRDEEVVMAYMWDGRAWGLLDQDVNVEVYYDGATYANEYYVVPKGAPDKELGFEFLRYYATHPEAQAEWMRLILYGTCSPEAYDLLEPETAQKLVGAHLDEVVPLDFGYLAQNEAVRERWYTWIAE